MNILEYQAKAIVAEFGVPVPKGVAVFSAEEAVAAAKELGGPIWVAKAQIHAGGRGKGGGVKVVKSVEDVRDEAKRMLGMTLVTHQTGPGGKVRAQDKIEAMKASGIRVADSPAALGTTLVETLGG